MWLGKEHGGATGFHRGGSAIKWAWKETNGHHQARWWGDVIFFSSSAGLSAAPAVWRSVNTHHLRPGAAHQINSHMCCGQAEPICSSPRFFPWPRQFPRFDGFAHHTCKNTHTHIGPHPLADVAARCGKNPRDSDTLDCWQRVAVSRAHVSPWQCF